MNEIKFYTVEQLAKMLGMKESTVRSLFREGTLKGKKIRRKWVITTKMLEECLSTEDERPSKPKKLSARTKNKMDLQAKKRSLDNLPERIAELDRDIDDISKDLPDEPGPEYGPAIQLLKDKIDQRGEMMEALATKDKKIEKMSSNAYPEVAHLYGRKRDEIVDILLKGIGEKASSLKETYENACEEDTRRQSEPQGSFAPEIQQQPYEKTMSVNASGGGMLPEDDERKKQ